MGFLGEALGRELIGYQWKPEEWSSRVIRGEARGVELMRSGERPDEVNP